MSGHYVLISWNLLYLFFTPTFSRLINLSHLWLMYDNKWFCLLHASCILMCEHYHLICVFEVITGCIRLISNGMNFVKLAVHAYFFSKIAADLWSVLSCETTVGLRIKPRFVLDFYVSRPSKPFSHVLFLTSNPSYSRKTCVKRG